MRSAGGKRTPVVLQHNTPSTSSSGEVSDSYATYATVLGDFRSLKGASYYGQQQVENVTEAELLIHHRIDVVASDRVLIDSVAYDLNGPAINVDFANRELLLRLRRATG